MHHRNRKLKFSVYRELTQTDVIPNNSCHPYEHKLSGFNYLINGSYTVGSCQLTISNKTFSMHLGWLCGIFDFVVCAVFFKVNCPLIHSLPLQNSDKENSKAVGLKKHYSDDMQFMKKRQTKDNSIRRILKSQN